MRETVNYDNPHFQQVVAEDLRQAAIRPQLRQQYFQLAFGASESCQDRITLTWNGMQTARLNADVEDGAYDDRLGELIQQARVLFRLDALEPIARQKVGSLQFVDEIEVYLAYQVKLRERLDLQLVAPDMRFFDVAYVTEHDLTAAETQVRNEEAAGFADYLATRWQPWETVVSRIAPEAHAEMQDRLAEAMDGEFKSRLDQRLADHDLTGNSDAELQFGAQIARRSPARSRAL
ncbi:NEL-type E3 ubiquitin ligase domain-containing protein [Bradyrhizobium sp. RDT10]